MPPVLHMQIQSGLRIACTLPAGSGFNLTVTLRYLGAQPQFRAGFQTATHRTVLGAGSLNPALQSDTNTHFAVFPRALSYLGPKIAPRKLALAGKAVYLVCCFAPNSTVFQCFSLFLLCCATGPHAAVACARQCHQHARRAIGRPCVLSHFALASPSVDWSCLQIQFDGSGFGTNASNVKVYYGPPGRVSAVSTLLQL